MCILPGNHQEWSSPRAGAISKVPIPEGDCTLPMPWGMASGSWGKACVRRTAQAGRKITLGHSRNHSTVAGALSALLRPVLREHLFVSIPVG